MHFKYKSFNSIKKYNLYKIMIEKLWICKVGALWFCLENNNENTKIDTI